MRIELARIPQSAIRNAQSIGAVEHRVGVCDLRRVRLPTNLSDLLRGLATTHRERVAVIGEDEALAFAALDGQADAWAGVLREAGFGPGAHIGLLAGNGP